MNLVAQYRRGGSDRWLLVIAAPGETFAELEAGLRRQFEDLVDVRPRDAEADVAAERGTR